MFEVFVSQISFAGHSSEAGLIRGEQLSKRGRGEEGREFERVAVKALYSRVILAL